MTPQGKQVARSLLSAPLILLAAFFGFWIVILGGLGLLALFDHITG